MCRDRPVIYQRNARDPFIVAAVALMMAYALTGLRRCIR